MSERPRKKQTLTSADTAWYRMERPDNPMCITGLLVFDGPIAWDRFRDVIQRRLVDAHERFRMRVVEPQLPLGRPHWEEVRSFDIEAHLHRAALPAPGDDAALRAMVGEIFSTRIDFSRPPWQIHLIEGYRGEGCAVVSRIHHVIGDGASLVNVMLGLTDADAAGTPVPTAAAPTERGDGGGKSKGGPLRNVLAAAQGMLHEGWESILDPGHALDLAKAGLAGASAGATAIGKLTLMTPEPASPIRGKVGVVKRVAWSEPLPVTRVKEVGRALDGTINDCLLSVMTGALRRYLAGRGEASPAGLRAICPVDLRPRDRAPELGNQFGLVFLDLPVEIADPAERVVELKHRMDEIKKSPEAIIAYAIIEAMGSATQGIEDQILDIFSSRGSAVMTNVPGPRQALYFAGEKIATMMFWVPTAGAIGLGVSILSYAGQVRLGVTADATLIPDPGTLVEAFATEFAELAARTDAPDA